MATKAGPLRNVRKCSRAAAMAVAVIVASFFGAMGTVLSAWIAVRVQKVQRTVNGNVRRMQRELDYLRAALAMKLEGEVLDASLGPGANEVV